MVGGRFPFLNMNLLCQTLLIGILLTSPWDFAVTAFSTKAAGSQLVEIKMHSSSFHQVQGTTSHSVFPQLCPGEDYSPCRCRYYIQSGNRVTCENVPLVQVQAVMQASKTEVLEVLTIYMTATESTIPNDLLGGKKTWALLLVGQMQSIKITPTSFPSTKESLSTLQISMCYATDFGFLDGFSQITMLGLYGADESVFHALSSMPLLPNVNRLDITQTNVTKGLNGPCPNVAVALSIVYLSEDYMGDASMSLLLKCLLDTSRKSITELYIFRNMLTTVPQEATSFEHLIKFVVSNNNLTRLAAGSLNFSFSSPDSCLQLLDMHECEINYIDPGAFVGFFGCAVINLKENGLTRFDSSVFLEVLTQMSNTIRNKGNIDIQNNPIDCETDPCHLEWLIVHNRRMVGTIVKNGRCSNGTSFDDLNSTAMEAYCTAASSTTMVTDSSNVEDMSPSTVAESTTAQSTLMSLKTDASTALLTEQTTMPMEPETSILTRRTFGETGSIFTSTPLGSSANPIAKKISNNMAPWGLLLLSAWISVQFASAY